MRWRSRRFITLVWIAIASYNPFLTVPGLSISWSPLPMLFQYGSLDLGTRAKSIESVSLTKINFSRWQDFIYGTVLAARIRRITPMVSGMASIGRGRYGVVRLLVFVQRIDAALSIVMAV